MDEKLRILEFSAENFKRLRMVAFRPKGRITMLTGKNDQGKSSVLDAVSYVFGGAKAAPEMPMRRGATRMEVKLDLGSLIAKRTGTRLEVTPAKGEKAWNTPQAMLDSIYDELAFNPQEFALMKAEAQAEALRKVAGVDEKLKELDSLDAADYQARTPLNAEAKRLTAEIASITVQDGLPKEKIDTEAIAARIRDANARNQTIATRIQERIDLEGSAKRAEQTLKEQREFIAKTSREIEEATPSTTFEANAKDAEALAATMKEKIETWKMLLGTGHGLVLALTAVRSQAQGYHAQCQQAAKEARARHSILIAELEAASGSLASITETAEKARAAFESSAPAELEGINSLLEEHSQAELTNRLIDKRNRQQELEGQRQKRTEEAHALTRRMEDREEERRRLMAGAELPLPGLQMSESQVTYNGIPVKQLGEARQILLGVAIGIAREPKLRLALIPHGEALDDDALAELHEMAEKNDFYVWIAKVDSSGKVGIYIDDGLIAKENETE